MSKRRNRNNRAVDETLQEIVENHEEELEKETKKEERKMKVKSTGKKVVGGIVLGAIGIGGAVAGYFLGKRKYSNTDIESDDYEEIDDGINRDYTDLSDEIMSAAADSSDQ